MEQAGVTVPVALGDDPVRLMLVAGEASGDMHGADVVHALRERCRQGLRVEGVGGPGLRAAGMEAVARAEDLAVVGVFEGWRGLRRLWRTYRTLRQRLRTDPPDLCLLIDFPEFNVRLARAAKRAGVPVLYYIGPQVWAWRRGRVRTIARVVDRLAVVFPFEVDLYRPWIPNVHFVGHPLLDRVPEGRGLETTRRRLGLDPARRTVLLLPGSRHSEIRYLLPPFLDAARRLQADDPDLQCALALAPTLEAAAVEAEVAASGAAVRVLTGATYDLMSVADLALVTSGTATLECALLACPMVVAYRLSPVTAAFGRLLIRGVRHIGMPNIVAGREIVPELIQREATGEGIALAARRILGDDEVRRRMIADLRSVRAHLGRHGAAGRVAELALELAGEGAA